MLEAVVVGGGIAGSAAALALRDRDVSVKVVEAGRAGGGATGASAGMLAPQYEVESPGELFDWGVEARARWPGFAARLSALSGRELVVATSGMLVANSEPGETSRARRAASWQRDRGLRAELLDPTEARELEPGVNPEADSFLWLPDEGSVDAQSLSELLSDALASAGVRVLAGNPVRSVESRSGSVTGVRMEDGRTLAADCIIVAAGAWTGRIDGLPRPVPVRPVKGQLLRYRFEECAPGRIVATHDGAYLVPRSGNGALAGSTMEEAGFDRTISGEARGSIRDRLDRAVTLLEGRKPQEQWAGLRPISRDGLPIIGPDPELEGLHYATGYGRNGILLAPLCGEVVAELASGGTDAGPDWRPFRPGRFEPG